MKTKNRRILRPKEVRSRTGYGRTSLWAKSRDPDDAFPSPVQLGVNSIGFYEDEISLWLETRPRIRCSDGSVKAGLQEANGDHGAAAAA